MDPGVEGAFEAAANGDRARVVAELRRDPALLHARGPSGQTLLYVAAGDGGKAHEG